MGLRGTLLRVKSTPPGVSKVCATRGGRCFRLAETKTVQDPGAVIL